jgi:Na+/proline symporter
MRIKNDYHAIYCGENQMVKILISFMLSLFVSVAFFSTSVNAQQQDDKERSLKDETMSDLLVVVAAGGGGAILGLSTLSFEKKPSEKYRNVIAGAALGIIAGVIVVAYSQANKSKEHFSSYRLEPSKDFDTTDRIAWHSESVAQYQSTRGETIFSFSF